MSPTAASSRRLHTTSGVHTWLMLAPTFSTGVVDAVGYLGLDRVFTGNVTGNVAILGMALTGADDLPVAGPVVALVGFVAGAALGSADPQRARHTRGRVGPERRPDRHRREHGHRHRPAAEETEARLRAVGRRGRLAGWLRDEAD